MPDWIGYRWLIERYGLTLTQPLRVETAVGPSRATLSDGTTERRTVQELLRPEASLAGHLGFALKHEGVHLEGLSRLFTAAPKTEIEAWVRDEPTGQYAWKLCAGPGPRTRTRLSNTIEQRPLASTR